MVNGFFIFAQNIPEMKNIFLSSILGVAILVPGLLKAQYAIPNGSFENWTGTNKPSNWTVIQGKPTEGHLYSYTYIDSLGDTLHLRRSAKNGLSYIDMPMLDTLTSCIIRQKFAMTARPKYFSMNYAYLPENQRNQFQVSFIFTKWNLVTGKEDTVLAGDYNSNPGKTAQAWTTLLNADLTALYNPNFNFNPDSATITVTSSLQTSPNSKTVLLIDEIYFTDTVVSAGIKLPETESLLPSNPSAFPNPFSERTTIKYDMDQGGQVSLNVYDINGKKVAALVNGNQEPSVHEVVFDGSGLKNGVYYYRLQTGSDIQSGKLILAK